MKKRTKYIIIPLVVLFVPCFTYYITFLAPYNIIGVLKSNSFGVLNWDTFKEIPELANYFEGYDISSIKYLGSNSYEVFTNKGNFVVVVDYSDPSFWKYNIFKFDQKVDYFTNPM